MHRFNLKKILMHVMAICLVGIVVFTIGINADAVEGDIREISPTFKVTVKEDHADSWVGEEIEIKGTITPSTMDIPNAANDIILAIDVSKSMGDSAGIECTITLIDYCVICKGICKAVGDCKWDKKKCVTHGVDWDGNGQPPVSAQCTIKRGDHSVVKNYCQVHNKGGKHDDGSTKLDELKRVANTFVDEMKNVQGVNLGIVTYSKKAAIKKSGKTELFNLDTESDKVKSIIAGIDVENEPGSNTGEAIRKSNYILNKSKSLTKNMVLFTDGVPTYYSKNSEGQENTDINDTDPSDANGFGGDGKNMTNETKGYAMRMGKNIKDKGYNTFTISYGMTQGEEKTMEEIHGAMSDKRDNNLKANGRNIKEIFNSISASVKQSHTTKPITLNLNLDDNYGLMAIQNGQVVGDGAIRIKPITYNWVEADKVYKGEPVDFEFSLVGTKKLKDLNIFEKAQLIIQFGEEMFFEGTLPEYRVTLNEQIPNISATYTNISPENPIVNEDIDISYEIELKDFDGSDISDKQDSYTIKDIRLKFNLGDNMLPVSGLEPVEEGSKEYYFTVPEEVVYIQDNATNMYKADKDSINITFKVKVNKVGIISFGESNFIEYTGIGNVPMSKKIFTPSLYIENMDILEHGLYGGVVQWYNNGKENYVYNLIDESKDKSFARGATLTMGAKFRLGDISSTLSLRIADGLKVERNPTIYVQDNYGKLIKVGEMSTDYYDYSFENNISYGEGLVLNERSIMVVLYNVTLPNNIRENEQFDNNIYLKGSSKTIRAAKAITIIGGKEELPDLF